MASDWHETTVGQFSPFKYGKGLPERDRKPGNINVYSSAGIVGKHDAAYVENAGVIIGRKGTVGSVYYSPSAFWPIDTAFYVDDLPESRDIRYTYYLLKTLGLEHMNTDSAVPGLNRENAHALIITVPALPAQKQIADFLELLDDRITLLRETNKTLEAIAQAIFKSWFIDFDPVRAKIDGRVAASLDEKTAALFPDELVESELGSVPKGWDIKTVGDVIDTVGGATPDTKNLDYWEPAEHYWTSPKDLSGINDPVLLSTERLISSFGLSKISSGLLPAGTLLMSSRAPIGYLAITNVPVAINQGYIAMPPGGQVSPLYMLRWCQANMEGIKGRANGSTFMEISKKAFRPIPILLPNKELLDLFEVTCGTLFDKLVLNSKQAQTLCEIRNSLLPRLISGKLRVETAALAELD